MATRIPDDFSLAWFLKNKNTVRDIARYADQHTQALIVAPSGKIAPGQYSDTSKAVLYDLRDEETGAIPAPITPPVLTVTEDDPALDVTWTLPEPYDALFLERSTDEVNWTVVGNNLPGTQTEYEDTDVVAGTEYFYRIRGQVGGAYSAYSNVDSGMLTAGCVYAVPDDMADSTPFFQGFANGDFVDALWTTRFSDNVPSGAGIGSYNHAGNLFMSEDGKKILVTGSIGAGITTNILTRNPDDSFSVQELNNGGGSIPWRYTMSRDYKVAGEVDTTDAAYWGTAVTSSPTVDSGLTRWNYISPQGTRLYGVTTAGNAIERVIGGSDTTIQNDGDAFAVVAVDHCGECAVVEGTTPKLWKKIAGVWTDVGTLANQAGATNTFPAVVQMNGAGTIAIGNAGNTDTKLLIWDLTGTGTITATEPGYPGGTLQDTKFTALSSDGSIAVGYVTASFTTKPYFWLASENFATAHDLEAYFIAQGLTNFGSGSGEYLGIDNVVVNADGTAFAVRADRDTGERSLYYVAVPAPT